LIFSAKCNKITHNGKDRFLAKKSRKFIGHTTDPKVVLLLNARTRAIRGKKYEDD
jgi:hypothetical protein